MASPPSSLPTYHELHYNNLQNNENDDCSCNIHDSYNPNYDYRNFLMVNKNNEIRCNAESILSMVQKHHIQQIESSLRNESKKWQPTALFHEKYTPGKENEPMIRQLDCTTSFRQPCQLAKPGRAALFERRDSRRTAPLPSCLAGRRPSRKSKVVVSSSGTQTENHDLILAAQKPRHCIVSPVKSHPPLYIPKNLRQLPPQYRKRQQDQLESYRQQRQWEQWQRQQREEKHMQEQQLWEQQQLLHEQQRKQELFQQQLILQQQEFQRQLQQQQYIQQQQIQQQLFQQHQQQRQQQVQQQQQIQRPQRQGRPRKIYRAQRAFAFDGWLGEDVGDIISDTFIRFLDVRGREIFVPCLISEEDPREWRQFVTQQRTPVPGDAASRNRIKADAKMQILHKNGQVSCEKEQRPVIKSLLPPNEYDSKSVSELPIPEKNGGGMQPPIMTVSGNHHCAHCDMPLGRGAAMIVEALNLFYHLSCFRCSVCSMALGNGTRGADVRVRGHQLHCQKCFNSD